MITEPVYYDQLMPYTHELGYRTAQIAQMSYCDPEQLYAHNINYIQDQEYELQAIYSDSYIGFRGSSNIENWMLDLNTFRTEYQNTLVHKGFLKAWNQLKPQIMNITYNKNITITGHSLGGAIAQLASIELQQMGYNVTLITFGSPRVGNEDFGKLLNQQVKTNYRITHNRDPVVHVPYNYFGFIHYGQEVFYLDLFNYTICETAFESIYCGANTILPFPSVQQHLDYLIPDISTCSFDLPMFLQ